MTEKKTDNTATKRAETTARRQLGTDERLLQDDLANKDAQQNVIAPAQYSQGEFDPNVKETEQNDPKNAPDLKDESYGTIEDFEKKKQERLDAVKKDAEKAEKDSDKS